MSIAFEQDEINLVKPSLKEMLIILAPYKKRWLILLVFSLIGMSLYIQIPLCIQLMIKGMIARNNGQMWSGFIWMCCLLVLDGGSLYFRYLYGYFYIETHLTGDLRQNIVEKILKHSNRFIDSHKSGDLVATVTNDVRTITDFLARQFMNIIEQATQFIIVFVILYLISPPLVVVLLIFFPAVIFVIIIYRNRIHNITYEQRTIFGRLNSRVQQNLAGSHLVKSFCNESWEIEKYNVINKQYYDSSWKIARLSSIIHPSLNFIWDFARLVLLGIGGYFLLGKLDFMGGSSLSIDEMVAFIPALDMFLGPITFISWIGGEYGRIQASFGRIKRIMDEPIEIIEKPNAITIPQLKGDITFDNINFSYIPNKPVLNDISIDIPAGSTVAFLGATGCGKSTLIHLLTRAYELDSGKIILDHQYNLQDITLDSYIPQIGVVSQEPFLFQQSFLENLTHGIEHYSYDDMINACKIADIDSFIQSRENKYETIIGERGVTLSGGQKQRVTLARALVRKPRILILDAATSSVDVDTEYLILKNLKQIFGLCTTIIITQRLSTVRNADFIYVLDKGQISEQGTHSDLIAKKGAYAQLYSKLNLNNSKNSGGK